jgi:hypothetical protein
LPILKLVTRRKSIGRSGLRGEFGFLFGRLSHVDDATQIASINCWSGNRSFMRSKGCDAKNSRGFAQEENVGKDVVRKETKPDFIVKKGA